jgi:5'-nucleotidase
MSISRRNFLSQSMTGALLLGAGLPALAKEDGNEPLVLTILHTNDVHSQIDPMPATHPKYPNQGGFARRAAMIRQVRSENAHVLLLDSGDIFQGSPYFNFYKGKLEIDLMNKMGYDVSTLGNHEFDNGVEMLSQRISEANFPFLNCNYTFDGSVLQPLIKPYRIIERGRLKIGLIGVGIELNGLIDPSKSERVGWRHPVELAENTARLLKEEKGCHYVICLSHLGYQYDNERISDVRLAAETSSIDMILGGHTHTFMPKPDFVTNKAGRTVVINQTGWAGVRLGRLDVQFDASTLAVRGCDSVSYVV